MKKIFGNTSDIFVQPYGYFNNDTIKAMDRLGIRILSAAMFSENNFNKGRDIFNYTADRIVGLHKVSSTTLDGAPPNTDPPVYHVPAMVSFKEYENSKPVKVPINDGPSIVEDYIKKYGYSVIVFHPQDFMYTDESGRTESN
jgi:peptidoglycan/xylan/chitin deacetylase (PgdA/CDA1 family)